MGQFGEIGPKYPKSCAKTHEKKIQSLQLLVSHQMRTYSSVRALCGLNYTCFTGTRVLRQFGEIGSEYPNSSAGTNEKYPSLQILVSHQMRPYSSVRALCGFSYTCFTGIGTIWENWARIPQITCRDT